jgi:hypothetical protein
MSMRGVAITSIERMIISERILLSRGTDDIVGVAGPSTTQKNPIAILSLSMMKAMSFTVRVQNIIAKSKHPTQMKITILASTGQNHRQNESYSPKIFCTMDLSLALSIQKRVT